MSRADVSEPMTDGERVPRFVCGTRSVRWRKPGDWRVACATCNAEGSVPYADRSEACRVAVRDSSKPCRACGAS